MVVAGVAVAAVKLLDKGGSPSPPTVHHGSTPTSGPIVLKPISAHGFDALNLSDTGNENDNQAANAIDGTRRAGPRRTTPPPRSATSRPERA